MNAYRSITLFSCCLLVACAPLKKPEESYLQRPTVVTPPTESIHAEPKGKEKPSTKLYTQASTITSWDISGALAARNKQKSWTASINWLQTGADHYQIRLIGPLGGGTVIIEKHDGIVMYRDGSKKVTASNADKLLLEQTGVRLPVKNLYYWVRGIPAPGTSSKERHAKGEPLTQFNQSGYTITYAQYMEVNGMMLPSKIRLEGNGVLIKLVIKRWKF